MQSEAKKAVLIIPYYGKLPVQYEAWKHTARNNPEIDFLFVTDIGEIIEEDNIHLLKMTFDELHDLIQSKFDFPISLSSHYKLCDFKPAYGFIFRDWIRHYSFWGYCDVDVLFGKLSHFLTADVFESYDKILEHGHFTLYRNNDTINQLFMSDGEYPEFNYREVFSSPESFWFDEFYGMMLKSRRLQVKTYLCPDVVFDLNVKKPFFSNVLTAGEEVFFKWQDGQLYAVSAANGHEQEIAYVHFQKRDMSFAEDLFSIYTDCFYIFPGCVSYHSDYTGVKQFQKIRYKLAWKKRHIRDFFRRYFAARNDYSGLLDYYSSRQKLKERRKLANKMLCE